MMLNSVGGVPQLLCASCHVFVLCVMYGFYPIVPTVQSVNMHVRFLSIYDVQFDVSHSASTLASTLACVNSLQGAGYSACKRLKAKLLSLLLVEHLDLNQHHQHTSSQRPNSTLDAPCIQHHPHRQPRLRPIVPTTTTTLHAGRLPPLRLSLWHLSRHWRPG